MIRGLLSGLPRKTAEPMARQAGVHRKPVQSFVGRSRWDDEAVMGELRRHVAEELGDGERGVIVIDPSAFAKKGSGSCGVQRQWCGRLGKIENCQVGIFLAYATPGGGHAPLDRRLYLPAEWASDRRRRSKCHVPKAVRYRESWRIALELLDRCRSQVPHAWVAADEEFGRSSRFRAELRRRRERYFLKIPANLLVRDLEAKGRPAAPGGRGRQGCRGGRYQVPFCRADEWAARQPRRRWRKLRIRDDGEKGPVEVEAMEVTVRTREQQSRLGATERLVVIRTPHPDRSGQRLTHYGLSNAPQDGHGAVPLEELLRVHGERHRIEQVLEEGKGEVGLGQYEVRSWVGWHHHVTLALLALWFLQLEGRRVAEKKRGGGDGAADA